MDTDNELKALKSQVGSTINAMVAPEISHQHNFEVRASDTVIVRCCKSCGVSHKCMVHGVSWTLIGEPYDWGK